MHKCMSDQRHQHKNILTNKVLLPWQTPCLCTPANTPFHPLQTCTEGAYHTWGLDVHTVLTPHTGSTPGCYRPDTLALYPGRSCRSGHHMMSCSCHTLTDSMAVGLLSSSLQGGKMHMSWHTLLDQSSWDSSTSRSPWCNSFQCNISLVLQNNKDWFED